MAAKQSVIEKTLQLARDNEQKQQHPLGGHLGDLFRDVSDKLIVTQASPETSTIEKSYFDLKEQPHIPNLAETKLQSDNNAFKDSVVQKTLQLYKSNQAVKKTLDKVKEEGMKKRYPQYELPKEEKQKSDAKNNVLAK